MCLSFILRRMYAYSKRAERTMATTPKMYKPMADSPVDLGIFSYIECTKIITECTKSIRLKHFDSVASECPQVRGTLRAKTI